MPIELTGILDQRHIDAGLSIEEETDDFVMLLDPKGYVIANFTQHALSVEIKRAADEYLRAVIV